MSEATALEDPSLKMEGRTRSQPGCPTAQTGGSVVSPAGTDALLALARQAGMLVTLDGQIGRERYQSVAGSVAALERFAAALERMWMGADDDADRAA